MPYQSSSIQLNNKLLGIRYKDQLANVVINILLSVFKFGLIEIILFDKVKNGYQTFLKSEVPDAGLNDGLIDYFIKSDVPPDDPLIDWFSSFTNVSSIPVAELNNKFEENEKLKLLTALGVNYITHSILVYNGELIGIMLLHSEGTVSINRDQAAFLKLLSDQVAATIISIDSDNVVAKQTAILQHQLALINEFSSTNSWEVKFHHASQILAKQIPFDGIIFSLKRQFKFTGKSYYTYRYQLDADNKFTYIDTATYLKRNGLNDNSYFKLREEIEFKEASLYQHTDFKTIIDKYALHKMSANMFGAKENILYPLGLKNDQKLILSLFGTVGTAFKYEHLDFLHALIPTIASLIERELAYEELREINDSLKEEKDYLQSEVSKKYQFHEIIGTSDSLKQVFKKVAVVAPTDATVLLTGETGTGKELFARAIHNLSTRKEKVLVKVNCATLPINLVESELFGHERGSFTGAYEKKIGKFELANNSTIFLDEIGELPLETQAKLLRVLQERELDRIGGLKTIKLNVRIIAATNKRLEDEVEKGRFRSDLFYRLSVFPIELPPLRSRQEDIPELASFFIQKFSKQLGKDIRGITPQALAELQSYSWPGNIRELEHAIERALLLTNGKIITAVSDIKPAFVKRNSVAEDSFTPIELEAVEREYILKTLRFCNGRIRGKGGAAELLNVKPTTLESRMKKLNINKGFL